MKRIVIVLALLAAPAMPALAGGDWDDYYDDDYYYGRRAYHGVPVYGAPYYVPYGYYFADEPHVYGPGCKVERKWKRGRYKEKIECDDDD